ncbi:hypothetical protein MN608_01876 [Microdochium nivale]|nr:hypothetical protein MN608_01876 [Microdochium nivale]
MLCSRPGQASRWRLIRSSNPDHHNIMARKAQSHESDGRPDLHYCPSLRRDATSGLLGRGGKSIKPRTGPIPAPPNTAEPLFSAAELRLRDDVLAQVVSSGTVALCLLRSRVTAPRDLREKIFPANKQVIRQVHDKLAYNGALGVEFGQQHHCSRRPGKSSCAALETRMSL